MAPALLSPRSVTFRALACDYDGTLASNDRLGPEAIAALGRARAAGVRLVLVTGRTFFELTRVCEPLDLFDAVVAENGAVLYFPEAGTIRDQAPPPPLRLLAELDRRGIPYQAGRVIVGTARSAEQEVRAALAASGVQLELVPNRGALMLLPAGVSKGHGVRQVLHLLGLSFHDMLALGDAENDLDLFDACGFNACPSNAVPALQSRADFIFPGEDGVAIARAIEGPILEGHLPVSRSPRHRIELGWAVETAEPVTMPARGVNALIHGDPLSGKSWLAGAVVERLLGQRYAVCVIDPEGDYRVLSRLGGVAWSEVRTEDAMERALDSFERDAGGCVVIDLSTVCHANKLAIITAGLARIRALRRHLGRPHWVALDEAQYSLHREGIPEAAVGIEDKGFLLVTYRSSWLRESVIRAVDVLVLARTTNEEELVFLRTLGVDRLATAALPDLPWGEFVVIEPTADGTQSALTFKAAPRETPHVRHLTKYVDAAVPPTERFFFRRPDGDLVAAADSLRSFRDALAAADDGVVAHHAGRGDFSRWVLEVFSDQELAGQIRKTEARWARGELRDPRRAIEQAIAHRYGGDYSTDS